MRRGAAIPAPMTEPLRGDQDIATPAGSDSTASIIRSTWRIDDASNTNGNK